MLALLLTAATTSKLIMTADILMALAPVCMAVQSYLDSRKNDSSKEGK